MGEERARILEMLAKGTVTVDEAEKLMDSLKGGAVQAGKGIPKYLRVTVVSTAGDNVNVRVPLGLVRAGMKLTSLIPPQAMDKINTSMKERGMQFDLNALKFGDIDELLDNLREMEVNVDSKTGDTVRVFCE